MNLFELRMLRAALKQMLRDQADNMTAEEIDQILDHISRLTKVIDEMERNIN
ncbi:hypothetical protein CLV60_10462 [Dyadobacter jiangsuensis]|uniref:Uncharacterized protein n=1 Tax=Dyadobacter jiangsuensis TaxID=1591085 RepID=A0A2P8G823_9BACT|nr:hypothetical protein CLV60_10462 [Dyadobacter jiangsuensis]